MQETAKDHHRGRKRARITTLPEPTSTALRSSFIIPTYPSVLQELLHNSLDAGATRIDIWIDASAGNERVRVEDDGCGIPQSDLRSIGGRYETSKGSTLGRGREDFATGYGFRGEALSSIAALGIVDITTKTRASQKTYSKVLKSSEVLFEGVSHRSIQGESGTIITVKELFHNIPVRQRRLADKTPQSTLMACRKIVETLALIRPGVKWTMWEEAAIGSSKGARQILNLSRMRSSLDVYRAIYGTASVEKVQKVRVMAGRKRVEGFVSLEGSVNKSHQHLYINSFPVERGDLQHAISKRFAASRFSALTQDSLLEDTSHAIRKSPRKLERHPIYVLNVNLPPEEVDLLYEPRKMVFGFRDVDEVKALILAVVDEFLKRHGFTSFPIPAIPSASPHRSPVHAALGQRTQTDTQTPLTPVRREPVAPTTPLPVERAALAQPQLFSPHFRTPKRNRGEVSDDDLQGSHKKRACPASSLSGVRSSRDAEEGERGLAWLQQLITQSRSRMCRHDGDSEEASDVDQDGFDTCADLDNPCRHAMPVNLPRSHLPTTDITFSAFSLAFAKVLGQVDRKFIACVLDANAMPNRPSQPVLVIIDQHAADERVSVERILEELCLGFLDDTVETVKPDPAPVLVLSREEITSLGTPGALNVFRRWGIGLNVPGTDDDYVQVTVQAVPKALAARLGAKDGKDLTRLVKVHLSALLDGMEEMQALLAESGETDVDWGRAMRWIPREMLELANSKACRGSIMFGDKLNKEQCERLIRRLGETRQGFMCAHGRPSLVPLAVLAHRAWSWREFDWSKWENDM